MEYSTSYLYVLGTQTNRKWDIPWYITPALMILTDLILAMISCTKDFGATELQSPPKHTFEGNLRQSLEV